MRTKKYLLFIPVLYILLFEGCATLIKGTTEDVYFTSNPSEAKVYVNGANLGKTPLNLELKSNQSYTIEFEKKGYENRTILLNNSVSAGYVILDIICGIVPVIVDAATGSWFTLDHNYVNVKLETEKE